MTNQSQTTFNPEINETLLRFLHLLLEANERTNLTAIKDFNEAYIKHLQDSLAISLWDEWKNVQSGIDLGTGGGLPGIPLAICYPEKQFYLMESNSKKVNFLNEAINELKLDNVQILHGRAEEYGQKQEWREKLDFVTSRAVSSLSVLMELSAPFLKIGGSLIAYKGPNVDEEIRASDNARRVLNLNDQSVIKYSLLEQVGSRFIIVLKKSAPTPKIYPRRPGMPEKRPL